MAGEWVETTLQEIAAKEDRAFAMGPFGSNIKAENYRASGVPVIRGTNLGEVGGAAFIANDFVFLDEQKANDLTSSSCAANDLVFVAQGTVGKVGLVPYLPSYKTFILSQNLMKVTLDTALVDPRYVFYFYRSTAGQHEIMSRVNPTGVPCISKPLSSLRQFGIRFPKDVSEQYAIAHVLSILDDKIELNSRMNETQESMVNAIFKSWFVDFDPVRAKLEGRQQEGMDADTAALFPSSFQDSPLGLVPKGWMPGTLGDVAENPRRGIPADKVDANTPYIGLEHMPKRCIALSEWGYGEEVVSNKSAFNKGEFLFGKLRPYFHKVGVAPVDGVCSTDILVVLPKDQFWYGFVLSYISSDDFINYTDRCSAGTKMPRTNWNDMSRYQLVLPPPSVAAAFTKLTKPMIERITSNIHESHTLAVLRDTLLPKLLSGEVQVTKVDRT